MLASVASNDEASLLLLEEITADPSGRSFTLKRNGQETACFWLSEKSKPAGDELLSKMKSLLVRRPTLAQLTGIQELRLNFLASYLPSALQTPCATSMEVSQASSVAISLPTRTSASAVIPHFSSFGQSLSASKGLQECSMFRSLSHEYVSQSSQEGIFACDQGLSSCSEELLNPLFGSPKLLRDSGESSREGSDLFGSKTSVSSSTQHDFDRYPFNNVINKNWNTSWSTRTSITFGSNGTTESTYSDEMGSTESESTSVGAGQNNRSWSSVEPLFDRLCLPVLSQTLFPFPSLASESPNSCTLLPPLSARLPVSSPSLLSPYYCPCPLGGASALHYTFSSPCLPSVCSESELLPTSSFLSVETSVASFPPASLQLHEVQYSFPLPVSPFPTAGLLMHSPGVSSMFGAPVSHFPVASLHVPTQGYLVQALPVVTNFGSPVVPDYFQDICTHHKDLQGDGHRRSFPSNHVSERSCDMQAMVQGPVAEPDSLSTGIVIDDSSAFLPQSRGIPMSTQIREKVTFNKLNASRFICDAGIYGMNDEANQGAMENMPKDSFPSLLDLPVLDMAPRVLSSSSLSRIISFRTTGDSTGMNLRPNSLGLYSVSCEMGYNPATSFPGTSKVNSSACLDRTLEFVSEGDCQDSTKLNPTSTLEDNVAAAGAAKKINDGESEGAA